MQSPCILTLRGYLFFSYILKLFALMRGHLRQVMLSFVDADLSTHDGVKTPRPSAVGGGLGRPPPQSSRELERSPFGVCIRMNSSFPSFHFPSLSRTVPVSIPFSLSLLSVPPQVEKTDSAHVVARTCLRMIYCPRAYLVAHLPMLFEIFKCWKDVAIFLFWVDRPSPPFLGDSFKYTGPAGFPTIRPRNPLLDTSSRKSSPPPHLPL